MKQWTQWSLVLAGSIFVGWSHAHTDEIPVVLGIVLILSAVLGCVFPSRPWLTGFLLGIPPFIVELLAHFGMIQVPYRVAAGIPWAALFGLVPGMGGTFFGSAIRHLNGQTKHGG